MRVGVRCAACFDLANADRHRGHAQPDGTTDTIADTDHDRVTIVDPDGITDTNTIAIAVAHRDDRRPRSVLRGR